MEVITVYKCECNGKTYPTKQSLKQHQRTKGHQQWENSAELRDLKIQLTKRDNRIMELQLDKKNLQELNLMLMKRISDG